MFRIHFDHRTGQFVVQVLRFGLLWLTVRRAIAGPGSLEQKLRLGKALSWESYAEARKWIEKVGLADLYDEQHPKSYKQFVMNGGVR